MPEVDNDELLGMFEGENPGPTTKAPTTEVDDGDSPEDFLAISGLQRGGASVVKSYPWMEKHFFKLVRTADELDQIVDAAIASGKCALDLETEGLDNRIFYDENDKPSTKHKIVGFCLSYDGVTGYYAPIRHVTDEGPSSLNLPVERAEAAITRLCKAAQPAPKTPEVLLKDPLSFRDVAAPPQVVILFWNAKFDQEFLYPVTGIDWWHPESFEDGNLAYYTYYSDDKKLGLKWKAHDELKDAAANPYEMIELKELFPDRGRIDFASLDPDDLGCTRYACSDAICTYLLCTKPRQWERRVDVLALCSTKYNATYRIEKQTAQAVRWMERPRVRVNREKVRILIEANAAKRDEVLAKIVNLAISKGIHGFDPKSTKVLGEFLFGPDGLNITVEASADWPNGKPPLNEKSGQFKTDADTLERLVKEHANVPDVLQWIVDWRGFEKMDSTYLQNMYNNIDERSEMRFQFKQTGAATGRFSAPAGEPEQGFSGIPIHGIPGTSALRTCFEARDGYTIVKADYAGEELRIAANVSGEYVWIKEFLEGDGDLHSITARAFFGPNITKDQRKMGKVANFALLYGGGPAAIMRATGCDKLEASRRKSSFDKAVPTFAGWIKGQHQKVKKDKGVWTALGRWIAIPDIDHIDKAVVAGCERKSTNFPIQGTGADIMKISLVLLCKEFYKLGWLKQGGGDDSIRMLLTVHDEIVFEIKHARVQEALALICKVMAAPTVMAGPPHSPKWKVPLIVEPLIGNNWAGEFDYGMLMHGKPYKQGDDVKKLEIVVGDRVYHKVPAWLEGLFKPGWESAPPEPEDDSGGHTGGSEGTPPAPAPTPAPVAQTVVDVAPAAPVAPKPASPAPTPPPKPSVKVDLSTSAVVVIRIGKLTAKTIKDMLGACAEASEPDPAEGKILCLTDELGHILIDPSLNIRVRPEVISSKLIALNLGSGAIHPYHLPS